MTYSLTPLTLLLLSSLYLFSPAMAGLPATLTLERSLPVRGVSMAQLKSRDLARVKAHNRRFLSAAVVDFPVEGSADPSTAGLYYTRVKLGNPQQEFYVQIDTGSDILWVTCNPCNGCPTSTSFNLQLEFFDSAESSSAKNISCSDSLCSSAMETGEGLCDSSSQCSYSVQYGDGSSTSGYYVSDTMYLETISESGQLANSSANIVFGCSNNQSGDLSKSTSALDGIFGFGQSAISVISQLSSTGVAPKVFSHCLQGSASGGGTLLLGEIVEPGIVYTPLVQSVPHYNLNLENIAVNGQALDIDSSVFSTSANSQETGTVVDSGTTLAYLAEQAYDTFVNGIASAITSPQVQSVVTRGNQCFVTFSSVDDVFPTVTLNFANNASMNLKPENYLVQEGSANNAAIWCIGWQKNSGATILGDLVLKDKIVVYDLANQRLGWVDYDCSQPVNVSASTTGSGYVNTRQANVNAGSSRRSFFSLLPMSVAVFLAYIFTFPSNWL